MVAVNRKGKKIEVRRREEREGEREKAKKLQLSKSKNIARTYESKSPTRVHLYYLVRSERVVRGSSSRDNENALCERTEREK